MERLIDMTAMKWELIRLLCVEEILLTQKICHTQHHAGEVYESGNFMEVLEQTLELMDWDGFAVRKTQSEKRGLPRGEDWLAA